MSHLEGVNNRQRAATELVRIVKPGAPIFVSVIGRLSLLIDMGLRWQAEIDMTDHFRGIWKDGDDYLFHKNSFAHYYLPDELEELFIEKGVEILNRVGLEGFAHVPEKTNALTRRFPNTWTN